MNEYESSRQEGTDDESTLPASTTRFGHYAAETVEETANYTNAMRDLERADRFLDSESHGLAATSVRGAARKLNRLADTLEAEQEYENSEGR